MLQFRDRAVDALQDHTRETNNRVQRGAQFMAHICEELTLEPVDLAHFHHRLLREFVRACVVDRHRHLICKGLKNGDFIFSKSVDHLGLDIDRADDAAANAQWNSGFSAGLWKHGVEFMQWVSRHIVDDDRVAFQSDLAYNGLGVHLQGMFAFLHFSAGFTGGFPQCCVKPGLFHDEDASVIETEPIVDEIHRACKDGVHIERGRDDLSDLGGCSKIFVTTPDGLFSDLAVGDV